MSQTHSFSCLQSELSFIAIQIKKTSLDICVSKFKEKYHSGYCCRGAVWFIEFLKNWILPLKSFEHFVHESSSDTLLCTSFGWLDSWQARLLPWLLPISCVQQNNETQCTHCDRVWFGLGNGPTRDQSLVSPLCKSTSASPVLWGRNILGNCLP